MKFKHEYTGLHGFCIHGCGAEERRHDLEQECWVRLRQQLIETEALVIHHQLTAKADREAYREQAHALAEARATNTRLNRRAQEAESALKQRRGWHYGFVAGQQREREIMERVAKAEHHRTAEKLGRARKANRELRNELAAAKMALKTATNRLCAYACADLDDYSHSEDCPLWGTDAS